MQTLHKCNLIFQATKALAVESFHTHTPQADDMSQYTHPFTDQSHAVFT